MDLDGELGLDCIDEGMGVDGFWFKKFELWLVGKLMVWSVDFDNEEVVKN